MKRSELRPDPEKVREWLQHTRKPLRRTHGKRRRKTPVDVARTVAERTEWKCVVCGKDATTLRMHRHHLLPVREWPEYELTSENQVLTCELCHTRHERAFRRITLAELPAECSDWLLDRTLERGDVYGYVRKTYPPTMGGRTNQQQEVQDARGRRRDSPW